MTAPPEPTTPRLNVAAIQRLIDAGTFRSSADLAARAGIAHTTLSRAMTGQIAPGARTIAGLIKATGLAYEDIVINP